MHCDSQVTITKAKSKNFNKKRRHLIVRYKSIHHLLSHGIISLDFIRFAKNIADLLTKTWHAYKYFKHQGEWD